MISFDEKGTVAVKAYGGRGWQARRGRRIPAKQPVRGTVELLAAYGVHTGRAWVRFFKRKGVREVARCLRWLKKRLPHRRLYVILDCWRAHQSPKLLAQLRDLPITLVPLPTNCSWLNPVERVLALIQRDVLDNSDFRDTRELTAAIRRYVGKEFPKKL